MARRSRVGAGVAVLLLAAGAALVLGARANSKATIEARLLALERNAPLRGRIETVTGPFRTAAGVGSAEWRYYRAGEAGPDRPVVVLVHGTPGSFTTWTRAVFDPGGLAEDCDVRALEMIGHGTTRTTLETYSFEACARWIGGFLDALDLRDVVLVGNSYGGEFVWRAAMERPDRVGRVVLMSPSGFPRRDDEWLPEEVKMRAWPMARLGWLLNSCSRVRAALEPHAQSPVSEEWAEEVTLTCSSRDGWNAMVDLARDENGTRGPDLAGLRQPTLLLWGQQDVAYPPARFAPLFATTIPRARLVLLAATGHYPQEEHPARVAREIAAFAREPR